MDSCLDALEIALVRRVSLNTKQCGTCLRKRMSTEMAVSWWPSCVLWTFPSFGRESFMWYTIFPAPPKQTCVLQACWRTQLSTKWHLQMEQKEMPQAIHLSWANPASKQILLDTTGLNSEYRNLEVSIPAIFKCRTYLRAHS